MGLSAQMQAPFAGRAWRRAAHVRRVDWRRAAPFTVTVLLFLAGCADLNLPVGAHREPSLRVADAALAAGAPEIALRVAELTLAREPRSVRALIVKGDALYAMGVREMARGAYRAAVAVDPTAAMAQVASLWSDPGSVRPRCCGSGILGSDCQGAGQYRGAQRSRCCQGSARPPRRGTGRLSTGPRGRTASRRCEAEPWSFACALRTQG